MEEVKTATKFTLPKKKVIVRPILERARGAIKDKDHEAYFLIEGTNIQLCAPVDRMGRTICPLTPEEIDFFESPASRMNFTTGDLSPYTELVKFDTRQGNRKKATSFWSSPLGKVTLTKTERHLDLSNPREYLDYKILLSCKELVAGSLEEAKRKPRAIYVIVEEDEAIATINSRGDKRMKAYMLFGKIEESRTKMLDFLRVYGSKATDTSKTEFLRAEVFKIVEEDTKKFLDILEDKYFEMKAFIFHCIKAGLIIKQGSKYKLRGGQDLSYAGELPTIQNAAIFLSDPENQDVYLRLKDQLENNTEE